MRLCPKCDGTGYVIDRMAVVFTWGIGLLVDWLMDDDENAVTKQTCQRCDGKGTIA